MENNNEIGKVFKDKLTLLDKKPSDNLWKSIETDLNKKRKRRILFWLIPGLLTLAVATSTLFFMNENEGKNKEDYKFQKQISVSQSGLPQEKTKEKENKQQSQETVTKTSISKSKPITKSTFEQSSETKTSIKKSRTEKLIKQSSKLVASTDDYEEYEVVKKYKVIIKKNKTITTTHKNAETTKTNNKKSNNSANKVASIKQKKSKNSKNPTHFTKSKTSKKPEIIKTKDAESDNFDVKNSEKKDPESKPFSNTEKPEITKKDSIATPPKSDKKPTAKREYVKKEYAKPEDEDNAEFSVSVYYGPAIFGSLSGQSTLNESFNDVSKSHPVTSHYGVYFKSMWGKYGFKAGFAKINLKISNHLNKDSNVTYDNMVISNTDFYSVMSNDEQIRLVQKISYYEIPLEFNYAIRKDETPYGIEAFSGFSVLISDANQLYLSSNNQKREGIGSTENLNKMNLSFNLGLGFNYKLTEKFQLDFNPIFKYYLTTFKDNKEPKPYSLSIQSGVTYKF